MTYTDAVYDLGDGILWTTGILFENVGNIFNYGVVVLGLIGIFIWLKMQARYIKEAKKKPEHIK